MGLNRMFRKTALLGKQEKKNSPKVRHACFNDELNFSGNFEKQKFK